MRLPGIKLPTSCIKSPSRQTTLFAGSERPALSHNASECRQENSMPSERSAPPGSRLRHQANAESEKVKAVFWYSLRDRGSDRFRRASSWPSKAALLRDTTRTAPHKNTHGAYLQAGD